MREFGLDDILSVTTGRLLSRRGMDGIYEILSYMTGTSVFTHQLPRVAGECAPEILRQHPQLADVVLKRKVSLLMLQRMLEEAETKYGKTLPIKPLDNYVGQDPIEELVDKMGPDRVIPVVVDE